MISTSYRNLKKEVCELCSKHIMIGQCTSICKKCDLIFHATCIKKQKQFRLFRENLYCASCISKYDIIRYNPFINLFENNDSDKFYDNEPIDLIESVEEMSTILENCQNYELDMFKTMVTDTTSQNLDNQFSTYFLNIDGNQTNFDQFVTELHNIDHNFSVIGLAETNIKATNKDIYQISDRYISIYQDSIENKNRGSGVGLYIDNKYSFSALDDISHCTKDIECLFVKITNTSEPITIGIIYRPPSGNIELFNSEIEELLSKLPNKNTYILGDFNINLHNMSPISHCNYEETILSAGYSPLISIATHKQPNHIKTCIDNIICNSPDKIITSGTLSQKISHHSPIFQISKIEAPPTQPPEKITIHYDYSHDNVQNFCSNLETTLNTNTPTINNFNEFNEIFKSSIDNSCKLETPKTTKRNSVTNPWITTGLIKSINEKNNLFKKWKKSINNKNKNGNAALHEEYKTKCKILKGAIRRAKQKYYFNSFTKHKGDKKKTWKIINELRGKKSENIKASFSIDNERIICRRIIADKFNNYFVSIASKLNANAYSEIPITEFPSFTSYLDTPCESSIFLEDCDANEIINIVNDFEAGKSSDIPIMLVKKSSTIIAPILARLYNNCMLLGDFPHILKLGKITPIYKKGNRELIENYRPISTLPIFGKIFEKIIYKRLYSFFTSKGIISDFQFGFRKGHSTGHALHHSVNIIKEAQKQKKHVLGIFIDLSKAFDTLDHNILLKKLENSGIRGTPNNLLASYLSNREQYTNVLGQDSSTEAVKFGVPQGSILGPLLFLLYINNITRCYSENGCKIVLYADDTNLFVIDVSRTAAITKANIILKSLQNFMKSNLLHINIGKCCFMHFAPTKKQTNDLIDENTDTQNVYIGEHIIPEVTQTKFLGVIIDNNLTWIPHIEKLHKKLKSTTAVLSRIRHFIPKENYKALYYSLFESHLTYCITVFGGANKPHIDKLFRVQKHCIRILFGDSVKYKNKFKTCARSRPFGEQKLGHEFYCKEHTKPIFHERKIMAVYNIYNYQTCLEILKILKFRQPSSIFSLFNISTRNNGIYLLHPSYSHHFISTGSKIWNVAAKLLAKTEDIISLKIGPFKQKLKNCLLEIQNKYNNIEWYPNNFKIETAIHADNLS